MCACYPGKPVCKQESLDGEINGLCPGRDALGKRIQLRIGLFVIFTCRLTADENALSVA